MQEFAKSLTKTSSKVQEPKIYYEAINDSIYKNKWQKTVNKKLWILDIYQTWCYNLLPNNRKAIGYKWMFKVKYNLDSSIKRYKVRLVA